jgi:hypothetical protein
MTDTHLEAARRKLVAEINATPRDRTSLEALHGQVWNAEEFRRDYEAIGYLAPCVVAIRRSDGAKGSLLFQHEPRFYFAWVTDTRA